MTPKTAETLTKWLPLAGTILAIGIAWGVMTGQVNQKLDREEFKVHEERVNGQFEAVKDILCTDHPSHRQCR